MATTSAISEEILAKYEPVIGLEVHAQVIAKAKLFSGAATAFVMGATFALAAAVGMFFVLPLPATRQ